MNLSYFRRPNSAALAFLVGGAIWFVVGTFYGLFSAIHLVAPEFFNNVGALVEPQRWAIAHFVKQLPVLTPAEYQKLVAASPPEGHEH